MILEFILHFVSYWGSVLYYDAKIEREAAKICLLNQFTITAPLMYLFQDCYSVVEDPLWLSITKLFAVINTSNLLFYATHRLLHHPSLYDQIHSFHHSFVEPVAVSALYAHPVEHLVSNNLCFVLPVLFFRLEYDWVLLLMVFSTVNIVMAHSDITSNRSHRVHHRLYRYNYGFGDYLDKIFDTYKEIR
jgi:sterol desaturase/sphingolipid hydroxylase (fatty acid hydroxylase superfamily)